MQVLNSPIRMLALFKLHADSSNCRYVNTDCPREAAVGNYSSGRGRGILGSKATSQDGSSPAVFVDILSHVRSCFGSSGGF